MPSIVSLTNANPGFYALLGRFLSRREVVKQVGGTIWDDDDKVWFAALDTEGAMAGFAALTAGGAVESLYTLDEDDDRLAALLVAAAADAAGSRELHATVALTRRAAYESAGFEYLADKGLRYVRLVRKPPAAPRRSKKAARTKPGHAGQISIEGLLAETHEHQPADLPAASEPTGDLLAQATALFAHLGDIDDLDARMDMVNDLRLALREYSPMRDEPVDCVRWMPLDKIQANAYNPNVVAPPEMKLLKRSITFDGYTQPVVVWPVDDGVCEVVDGFHRYTVARTDKGIRARVRGRLPVAVIHNSRTGLQDRMAATVRHNRARGVPTIEGMSSLVRDFIRNGKSDEWIANELGMDPDEVLRLRQVDGIAEMFADEQFSEAWTADDPFAPTTFPDGDPAP